MTIEIAITLLAASIPVTALVLKFSTLVSPVQFIKLETQFTLFREEVRKDLKSIRKVLDNE